MTQQPHTFWTIGQRIVNQIHDLGAWQTQIMNLVDDTLTDSPEGRRQQPHSVWTIGQRIANQIRDLGLPRTKIMYLVDDTLTDSPEGMGLLRHCVEPAERLKEYLEQEAIGFLRDLRGIPI